MSVTPQAYLLVDACVLAGYYAPQTLSGRYPTAADRAAILFNSVKKGCSPHLRLITPEICVAEAQTVLSKHAHTGWTKKRKKDNTQSIHGKSYALLKKQMREDLHGGRHIESIPLQRYHVLARHLVTAVDHNLHLQQKNNERHVNALGGMDQLIAGVGTWLHRFLGEGRVFVVTTDYRLVKVLEKCRKLKEKDAKRYGLLDVAEDIGIEWDASIYPEPIHLNTVTDKFLSVRLGSWPLPTKVARLKKKTRKTVTDKDLDILVSLYQALKLGRDNLPYSDEMKRLVADFNRATGHSLDEAETWRLLLRRLKKGLGSKTKEST